MNKFKISEISVGQIVSFEETISHERIQQFTALTGDVNPLHVNEEYAKLRGYPSIVSHGLLTTSYLSKMAGVYIPGERSLLMEVSVSFLKPVYPDDKLIFQGEVTEVNTDFNFIDVKVTVLKASSKVLRGKIKVGVYSGE